MESWSANFSEANNSEKQFAYEIILISNYDFSIYSENDCLVYYKCDVLFKLFSGINFSENMITK